MNVEYKSKKNHESISWKGKSVKDKTLIYMQFAFVSLQAKKLEQPTGPNIIFHQAQFNGWTNYTLPKDFHLRNDELKYYEIPYGGKRGFTTEIEQFDHHHPEQFIPVHSLGRNTEVFNALGDETLDLFKDALLSSSPRKKSKLSDKIAGKFR